MNIISDIESALDDHITVAQSMRAVLPDIALCVETIVSTFKGGGKLLLAGNGGSAADAQHWAAEWIIRLNPMIKRPAMPVIALSTDTSIITACANDTGYENIFSRQVEALAESGDLLIVISTSGNSENLIRAISTAKDKKAKTMGVLGRGGGKIASLTDLNVIIPSDDTQRIQEMQEFTGHVFCEFSERQIYSNI